MRRASIRWSLAAILVASPVAAWAHAILTDSEPKPGGTIRAGRVVIRLQYNSRIDAERSRLVLTGPNGAEAILAINPEPRPDLLSASTVLAAGAYSLRWQVLAIDGHITRGDVAFTVTP